VRSERWLVIAPIFAVRREACLSGSTLKLP
jgi:hypothetical protein